MKPEQVLYEVGDIVMDEHNYQIHKVTTVRRRVDPRYTFVDYDTIKLVDGRGNLIKSKPADRVSNYRTKKLDLQAIEKQFNETVEKATKLRDLLVSELKK